MSNNSSFVLIVGLSVPGVTGGGREADAPSETSDREFLLTYREKSPFGKKSGKENMEKGENEEEKKETCKREGGKLKMEGGKSSIFFFFFFFCFSLFKTTKIFLVYQNGNFLPGKRNSRGEKIRKNDFAPSEKNSCYALEAYIVIMNKYQHDQWLSRFLSWIWSIIAQVDES